MAGEKIKIDWDDINRPEVEARVEQERRFRMAAAHYERGLEPSTTESGGRVYGTVEAHSAGVHGLPGAIRSSLAYMPAFGLAAAFTAWACLEAISSGRGALPETSSPLLQSAVFFCIVGALLGASLSCADDVMSGAFGKASRMAGAGAVAGLLSGACAGVLGQAMYGATRTSQHNIVMVLDVSGSMAGEPLEEVMQSSRRFLSELRTRRDVRVGIVSFSTDAQILCGVTDDVGRLNLAIDQMRADGATNMAAGLTLALSLLRDQHGPSSILLFSDGQPTALPSGSVEELIIEELRKRDLSVTQLEGLSESKRSEVMEDIRANLEEKYLKRPQREAQQAAESAHEVQVQVVTIGTAEADRSFLGTVASDSSKVLYARSGDISRAFTQAAALLFQSAGDEGRSGLGFRSAVRALSWGFIGTMLGLVQGVAMRSKKKVRNGVLGGLLGGVVGGALFDPIGVAVQTDWVSRLVALCVIGAMTGVSIGLVEAVLKEAWLLVTAGPLTGKQFVIYRNPTVFGSSPKADIYLFKDPGVEPQHATLHMGAGWYELEDRGTPNGTLVNGRRIGKHRLRHGDNIQIGQYAFSYAEKRRTPT